ncbi:transcription elongation factor GreB [Thiomicrospira cyclica]|uniref:Transcription elongation factor GreB n=1 Tax=Thiomicrospira cyclica (strain DSM 14477 / JCM 11371 / ALM1) TaxID=717773 RepID=F6DBJ4_THICA|nr:transcription elongation factor GreB [Thiomicrospira cyclica]AEG32396.1 transcription elongation factor GreB [Thiomicrospira cyclica ALM1]
MPTLLITRAGYTKLQHEFNELWSNERPKVTKIVAWAASLGDRSENADYQYNKKRLREIDRRLRYLRSQLEQLRIVDYHPSQEGKIYFGARVYLKNFNGQSLAFRIVGPDEIFHNSDYISIDAPMARACLQKSVGESVQVIVSGELPLDWEITAITYYPSNNS